MPPNHVLRPSHEQARSLALLLACLEDIIVIQGRPPERLKPKHGFQQAKPTRTSIVPRHQQNSPTGHLIDTQNTAALLLLNIQSYCRLSSDVDCDYQDIGIEETGGSRSAHSKVNEKAVQDR